MKKKKKKRGVGWTRAMPYCPFRKETNFISLFLSFLSSSMNCPETTLSCMSTTVCLFAQSAVLVLFSRRLTNQRLHIHKYTDDDNDNSISLLVVLYHLWLLQSILFFTSNYDICTDTYQIHSFYVLLYYYYYYRYRQKCLKKDGHWGKTIPTKNKGKTLTRVICICNSLVRHLY